MIGTLIDFSIVTLEILKSKRLTEYQNFVKTYRIAYYFHPIKWLANRLDIIKWLKPNDYLKLYQKF